MKFSVKLWLCVCLSASVPGFLLPHAQASGHSAPAPAAVATNDEYDAALTDATTVADNLGLPVEEVQKQIGHQDALDAVPFKKFDGYGGLTNYIGESYRIRYFGTEPLTADQWDEFEAAGLAEYVVEVPVRVTMESLLLAQQSVAAMDYLPSRDLSVDVVSNAVEIITSTAVDQEARARAEAEVKAPLEWIVADSLAQPALGGGQVWGSNCTAGFVVKKTTTGNRGMSTAGHCPTGDTSGTGIVYSGTEVMVKKNEWVFAEYDFEWWDDVNDTTNWENKIKDGVGSSGRAITSIEPDAAINIGDTFCKYGRVTGYTCGDVTSVTECPSYIQTLGTGPCASTYIKVKNNSSPETDMVYPTDSGGPAFFGNKAIAITSGSTGTPRKGIFMPVDFFTSKELIVATN